MPILSDDVNAYIEYSQGKSQGTIEDEWGIHEIFTIASFYILNRSAVSYRFAGVDAHGRFWEIVLAGSEELSYNIPTPARPDDYPLTVHWSRV